MLLILFIRSGVGAPVIGEITGEYHYDSRKSVLEWQLPVIDEANCTGSLEFTIAGNPDDFYPVTVSFYSTKTICDMQVGTKTLYRFFICVLGRHPKYFL